MSRRYTLSVNGMITKGAELFITRRLLICLSSIIQFVSCKIVNLRKEMVKLTVYESRKSSIRHIFLLHHIIMIIISNDHFREIITFLINPFRLELFHSLSHISLWSVIKSFNPISYSLYAWYCYYYMLMMMKISLFLLFNGIISF